MAQYIITDINGAINIVYADHYSYKTDAPPRVVFIGKNNNAVAVYMLDKIIGFEVRK